MAEIFFKNYLNFSVSEFKILDLIRERPNQEKPGKVIFGREKGVSSIHDISGLDQFLNLISFKPASQDKLSAAECRYLTGGWFEEWTYYMLKSKFKIADNQIKLGVISTLQANNDLDVVFIRNNDLYIIECKTGLGKDLQQSTLYKSGALLDKFGRAAKSYLLTLQDLRKDGKLIDAVDLRARQQNVLVRDRSDLMEGNIHL